jgi:CheY-like chemotaxis protein
MSPDMIGPPDRAADSPRRNLLARAWLGFAAAAGNRAGSEREIALCRLAVGIIVGFYLVVSEWRGEHDPLRSLSLVFAAFQMVSLGIFCHGLYRPGGSAGRRLAGILADLGTLSYCLHIGGEVMAPLYPLYLLIAFANGAQLGTAYLLAAAAVGVAGFALMAMTTEFWLSHQALSLGLAGGLILLPLSVLRQMQGSAQAGRQPEVAGDARSELATNAAHRGDLPAPAAAMPAPDADKPSAESRPSAETPRRLAVLLAEDNATSRNLIAAILAKAGHETVLVDDGQAAAAALAKRRFDLVLMDVDSPLSDGTDAAKLIHFMWTAHPRVPIMALTADSGEPTQNRCEQAGVDACIAKPVDPAELVRIVGKLVAPAGGDDARQKRPPQTATGAKRAQPRAQRPCALDLRTLESLESLGGDDFVEELGHQFIDDAADVLKELKRAVAKGDAQAFREHAHALRSGAANIGARGILRDVPGMARDRRRGAGRQGAGARP